jgi:hypothetical protein
VDINLASNRNKPVAAEFSNGEVHHYSFASAQKFKFLGGRSARRLDEAAFTVGSQDTAEHKERTDEAVADGGSGTGMDSDRKCEMALQVLRSASVHETAGEVQHSTGVARSGMGRAADMEPADSALVMQLHSMLCSEPCVSPSAIANGVCVDRQAEQRSGIDHVHVSLSMNSGKARLSINSNS